MKKLGIAIASLALLGSYSFANAQDRVVIHKSVHHGPAVKKVVIKHDRGFHRGWSHSEHRGAVVKKKVVISH
jgi:hypothetical protein